MGKESSIAPKERVNITYKPATGDAQEQVELPLKLLVMSDFTMQADDRMVEDRDPINVDKDNFNDVLKGQGLSLEFSVGNKLVNEEDAEMPVNLKFDNLKDFEPDAIVQKVPELKKLMELREALKALKGPLSNVPEFRKKVQELVGDKDARDKILKELGIEEG
ncbi:MAG: type VI secretion system contractile sheath small subunit [Desulfovibrio sp.]|uniref:type VI secretion system contractile sheath small subunit n=1 Tax=Desulfovibrio sp. 7SRBS1 TaxID=3378064 RepID=UPI003B3C14FA